MPRRPSWCRVGVSGGRGDPIGVRRTSCEHSQRCSFAQEQRRVTCKSNEHSVNQITKSVFLPTDSRETTETPWLVPTPLETLRKLRCPSCHFRPAHWISRNLLDLESPKILPSHWCLVCGLPSLHGQRSIGVWTLIFSPRGARGGVTHHAYRAPEVHMFIWIESGKETHTLSWGRGWAFVI